MNDENDAWARLARELGATRDAQAWLHVTVLGRAFSLMRTTLGASTLVVAHSVLAGGAELDPTHAAETAATWPVGSLVLHDGRWLSRQVFVGIPTAAAIVDILRGLAIQVRPLEPRRGERSHAVATYAHYAD